MSGRDIAAIALLATAIVSFAISTLGMFLARNTYTRLHAAGVANAVTSFCVVAAIIVEKLLSQAGIKAILIGLVFWICAPIVTHVTARSAHAKDR